MGYSGHGAQLATHMGEMVADRIPARRARTCSRGAPWPAVPGHFGKPRFLPLVGARVRPQGTAFREGEDRESAGKDRPDALGEGVPGTPLPERLIAGNRPS